jgi:hypothetical protein
VARIDPYRADVAPGGDRALEVIVTNHAPVAREARVRLRVPPGWSAEPAASVALVPPGGAEVRLAFTVHAPAGAATGRHVLTADLDLGDQPRGALAETLREVRPA